MRELTHVVANEPCRIYIPETEEDGHAFLDWMRQHSHLPLGLDTETTGLQVYQNGFRVRLVQIGSVREAWVLRADQYRQVIRQAILRHPRFIAHNFPFDAQVLDHCLDLPIQTMTPKVIDTIILSKLIEPHRATGHKLKGLSQQYVDRSAVDTQDGLIEEFHKIGKTKHTGWAFIDIDNETYLRYAGLDVLYVSRLFEILVRMARELLLTELIQFEHTIQGYLNVMQRRGLRIDLDYAAGAREQFLLEAEDHLALVRDEYGLENINSSQQVAAALLESGAQLTERTDSGQYKVDKGVLLPLAGMDEYWEDIPDFEGANPLARHIAKGRRAQRFGNNYLGKFIDLADPSGRIHPTITGVEARTSRSSVSDPPIQQLPSRDWKVRRAIIADPGHLVLSADYAQIEMRLVAALADIKKMKHAIENGIDLHGFTAELAYGPDFTPKHRTHMKSAGFTVVYGGGAKGMSRKLGISMQQARAVHNAYNRVYPEIKRWANKLQRDARANGMVMRSPSGRILALDRDRIYAAINYQVQSTAADVLKNAIEALFVAGLGDYLLMPVHDELVGQAPESEAVEIARAIGETMSTTVLDMRLDAEGEVYGPSWGHGYISEDELKLNPTLAPRKAPA